MYQPNYLINLGSKRALILNFVFLFTYLIVGGKKFCTTVDTLTHCEPDSMIAAMFSGRHTLSHESDKVYFISISSLGPI